jgi:hypothetical protein
MDFNDAEKLLKVLPPPDKNNCKLFGGVVKIPNDVVQRIWDGSETLEEVMLKLRLEGEVRGINFDKDLGIFTWWEKGFYCQQQFERESLKPQSRKEDPDPNEEVVKKPRKKRNMSEEYKERFKRRILTSNYKGD